MQPAVWFTQTGYAVAGLMLLKISDHIDTSFVFLGVFQG